MCYQFYLLLLLVVLKLCGILYLLQFFFYDSPVRVYNIHRRMIVDKTQTIRSKHFSPLDISKCDWRYARYRYECLDMSRLFKNMT